MQMKSFDECEKVYSTYHGGTLCAVMPLAFAFVCLAAVSFTLSLFAEVLIYGVRLLLTAAMAPVACLPLLKLALRQRHTKAGVCSDGLVLQNWRRQARFVPWEMITALVENVERLPLSGELWDDAEGGKYVLAIHVRNEQGIAGPVWIALCGFGSNIAVRRDIENLRDEIIQHCGFTLASDRKLGWLSLLWTLNSMKRRIWKSASAGERARHETPMCGTMMRYEGSEEGGEEA